MSKENLADEFEVDGLTVEIHYDQDAGDPRDPREEWDCFLGKMICFHSRYSLGDKHDYKEPDAFWRDLFSEVELTHEDIRQILNEAVRDKDFLADYRWYYQQYFGEDRWMVRENFIRDRMVDEFGWMPKDARDAVMEVLEKNYVILPLYLYDH